MKIRSTYRSVVAIFVTISALTLGACVTNEELGTPDGWEQVLPETQPDLAAMVPPKVRDRGRLTAAANTPYAPNEFKDSDGKIIGFEIDLVKAAASMLGLRVVPRQMDFNLILPALSAGTVDIGASAFTDTEERQQHYDFVDFFSGGVAWATQPDRASDIDPDNACGMTVSVQKGTFSDTDEVEEKSDECIAQGKPPIDKLVYPTADAAATATVLKRADAYSSDSSVIAYAIERADGKLKQIGEPFDTAPFGWAFPIGSELATAFGAALQRMIEDGTYMKILEPWGLQQGGIDKATINLQPLAERKARTMTPRRHREHS